MSAELARGEQRAWLWLSLGAVVASAVHVGIDFAVGAFPRSVAGVSLVALPAAALYAVWVVALAGARNGSLGAISAAAVLALVHAGLANGVAALVVCPPTVLWGGVASCPLAPWQDLSHLASAVFGLWAFARVRQLLPSARAGDAALRWSAIAVLVVHLTLAAIVGS